MSSTSLQVLFQPLSKTRDSFVLQKISHVFFYVTFNSETVFGFTWSSASLPQTWYLQGFKIGELDGHCFFWIICRQFTCRHFWAARAVYAEWHTSAAPSSISINKQFWLPFAKKITSKITLQWHHCHFKLVFCWNKWQLGNWKLNAQKIFR